MAEPSKYADDAYQQLNSVIAIGSGQLYGKGLYNTDISSVKNGNFIVEPQTDFIFAVTGEELGFIGVRNSDYSVGTDYNGVSLDWKECQR